MTTEFDDVEDLPLSEAEWVQAHPSEALEALTSVQPRPDLLAALDALRGQWTATETLQLLDQWPYEGKGWQPTKFLLPRMFPLGAISLLAGPGASGKTGVAMQLAVNCALGREKAFLSKTDFSPLLAAAGPVVWVTWETARGDFQKRLQAICKATGDESLELRAKMAFVDARDRGPMYAATGREPPAMTSFGLELLSRVEGYEAKLLILDPLAGCFGANENDRVQVRGFLSRLGKWSADAGNSTTILSHPSRGTGSKFSGSSDWEGGVQSRLFLARVDCDSTDCAERRSLRVEKINEGAPGEELFFEWSESTGALVLAGPCPHEKRTKGTGTRKAAQPRPVQEYDGDHV